MKTWQKVVVGVVIVGVLWWAYSNGYFSSPTMSTTTGPGGIPINPNAANGGGTGWTGSAPSPNGGGSSNGFPSGVSAGSIIVPGGNPTAMPTIDPTTGQPYVDASGNVIYNNIGQTNAPIGTSNNPNIKPPNTGNAATDAAIIRTEIARAVITATHGGGATASAPAATQVTTVAALTQTIAHTGSGSTASGLLHAAITSGSVH